MADEPRRVRTQVERDADGVAWRQTADTRPGFATYPQTQPGSPSWWRHDGSGAEALRMFDPQTMSGTRYAQKMRDAFPDVPPVDGETCAKWCGFCHLNNGEPDPPRSIDYVASAALSPADQIRAGIRPNEQHQPPRRRWWHRLTRRNP